MRRLSSRNTWVVLAPLLLVLVAACGDDGGVDLAEYGPVTTPDRTSTTAERRTSIADDDASPPRRNVDHWHAAYGVFLCDRFLPPSNEMNDPVGIHTHGDGIIHIHPFSRAAEGERATLGVFAEAIYLTLDDDIIAAEGVDPVREEHDTCDGRPATVQVVKWSTPSDAAPIVITEDVHDVRFIRDREVFTIAFVAAGVEVPQPPTVPNLDLLSDAGPTSVPPS